MNAVIHNDLGSHEAEGCEVCGLKMANSSDSCGIDMATVLGFDPYNPVVWTTGIKHMTWVSSFVLMAIVFSIDCSVSSQWCGRAPA